MNISNLLNQKANRINAALNRHLPGGVPMAMHLSRAMRYSVLSGGKRVRPFLVLQASRICGGSESQAMPLACAIEMIHAYSLIHDDLPSMDNDDYRRGKKTCHVKFDEATAILAGDALLAHAFTIMSNGVTLGEHRRSQVIDIVSRAIGPSGMVGGQAADMKARGKKISLSLINRINGYKTGKLITASLKAGAVWGGGKPSEVEKVTAYGDEIGSLFQLVDDIIDGDGYVRIAGVDAAYQQATILRDKAKAHLKDFGRRAKVLSEFADFLYNRKN